MMNHYIIPKSATVSEMVCLSWTLLTHIKVQSKTLDVYTLHCFSEKKGKEKKILMKFCIYFLSTGEFLKKIRRAGKYELGSKGILNFFSDQEYFMH